MCEYFVRGLQSYFSAAKHISVDITPRRLVVVFVPSDGSKTLRMVIKVEIGASIWIPIPLDNPNACDNCGITCSLVAGGEYTFNCTSPTAKADYSAVSTNKTKV